MQEVPPSGTTAADAAGADAPVVLPEVEQGVADEAAAPGTRGWSKRERDVLADWDSRVTAAQHAHYSIMTRLRRRNLWLGVPAVILTTVVGTSVFATLASSSNRISPSWRVLVGTISIAAAVLAGLQNLLKFGERAERHGLAADWFSAVRREIDQNRAAPEPGHPQEILTTIRKEINKIVQNAPEIGEAVWKVFAAKYGAKEPL